MSRQPNVLRLALTNDLEHQKVQHEQFQPTTLVYSPSKAPVKTTLSTRIRHMFVKFFTEWWMLEILSWMFSAICMIAIIVMLSISNGQRMSKFLPYGISLNSYVSILAGFARSALLLSTAAALGQLKWNWFQKEARNMLDFERMDMASRGPWGSMVLLSRSRGLSLASMGAAIMLLALPLELCFQQIISYPSVWVSISPNSTTPRALTFVPRDGNVRLNGTRILRPAIDFTSHVETFFIGPGEPPELQSSCPTSNCTWGQFDTLSVCSACNDVRQDLIFGCDTGPVEWLNNVTLMDKRYPVMKSCGYFLNSSGEDPILMSGYAMNPDLTPGPALGTRFFPVVDLLTRKPHFGGSLRFPEIKNPMWDIIISSTPDGPAGAYKNATPSVQECVLYWCVKTIQTSFYLGSIHEVVVKEQQMETQSSYPWNISQGAGHLITKYQADFSLTLPPRQQPDLQNGSFYVSNSTALQAIIAFDFLSPSYVTADNKTAAPQLRWLNNEVGLPGTTQDLPTISNPWAPPNNISSHIHAMAAALTNSVRVSPTVANGLQNVAGTAWDEETFVQIQWKWLALPLTLLSLSLAFLVAIVIQSSRDKEKVGIWKTSALGIFFKGFGIDIQKSMNHNSRMGEAREIAQGLTVRLVPETSL